MHLGIRSESFFRETIPVQSLGASDCAKIFPGTVDARSSLHHHNNNLGRMRAACLDRRSQKSLQRANLARKQVESFPTTIGIAPTLKEERSLSEQLPPKHFAFEEQTRQFLEHVPPPPQFCHEIAQLRAEVRALQFLVHKLVAKHEEEEREKDFKEENGAEGAHNTNQNNNNNNNNNSTNDNNNNPASQESIFSSLDLDNDNPESTFSGSDLDESSLGSFNPEGSVESSLGSEDQQEAACSFDKHHLGTLGQQMMTIGYSLGSLTQHNEESSNSFDQEGKVLGTYWDLSLTAYDPEREQHRDNFGKNAAKAEEGDL